MKVCTHSLVVRSLTSFNTRETNDCIHKGFILIYIDVSLYTHRSREQQCLYCVAFIRALIVKGNETSEVQSNELLAGK